MREERAPIQAETKSEGANCLEFGDAKLSGHPIDAAQWDLEYQRGRWNYLRGVSESGRHAVIAGYIHAFCAEARILDVGCGEARLLNHLCPCQLKHYTGVDISRAALAAVVPRQGVTLVADDVEHFLTETRDTYDAIVLSEVLYYCATPMNIVQRCCALTTEQGILAVSMNQPVDEDGSWRSIVDTIWKGLSGLSLPTLDDIVLHNTLTNQHWNIRVVRPRR